MFEQVLLTIALAQEGIYRQPATHVSTPVVVEVATYAGNGLFPRPAHSDTLNGGCNEWDVEAPELATDGTPCERTVDNYVKVHNYGDAVLTADDLAPSTCLVDGYSMVVSVWRARQLEALNPGLVCVDGQP